jgi:chemotaxis signal transduction protein
VPEAFAFFVCRIREQLFGIEVSSIETLLANVDPVAVPGTSSAVRGVVHALGHMMAVVDPAELLGFRAPPSPAEGLSPRVLVVKVGNSPMALAVDENLGIHHVQGTQLASPAIAGEVVSGTFPLGERKVSVIELERLLSRAEASVTL